MVGKEEVWRGNTMNHHAKVENSERLQAALAVLRKGGWRSAVELAEAASTLAIGSTISELRSNFFTIEHRYNGRTQNGRAKSEYRLID